MFSVTSQDFKICHKNPGKPIYIYMSKPVMLEPLYTKKLDDVKFGQKIPRNPDDPQKSRI